MDENASGYSTAMEIEFLQGLGTYRYVGNTDTLRAELLAGYINGCQLRTRWGALDRKKILIFAQKELAKIGEQVSSEITMDEKPGGDQ